MPVLRPSHHGLVNLALVLALVSFSQYRSARWCPIQRFLTDGVDDLQVNSLSQEVLYLQ